MYNNPYKAYQKTQVTTARPEKVLLMLYEGAIKFVRLAQARMRDNNVPEKGKYISKALSIISELQNTLDHNAGGQLAIDLENLYMFMMDKLIEANMYNKSEDLDAVERLLTILYSGWEDVINNPRKDGVPSEKLQPDLHQAFVKANPAGAEDKSLTLPSQTPDARMQPPKVVVPPRKA